MSRGATMRYALTYEKLLKTHRKYYKFVDDPDFDGNWWKRYFPNEDTTSRGHWCNAFRPDETTANGIHYDHELNSYGAHFFLFVPEGKTEEDIARAKQEIKHKRDVTGFSVYRAKPKTQTRT